MRRSAVRTLLLLAAAAAAAAVSNTCASPERRLDWIPVPPPPRQAAERGSVPAPTTGIDPARPWREIGSAEAEALSHRGALFLDARRSAVYREGHIAGARSFPVWESNLDSRIRILFEEGRTPADPIVVYCSGGECEDSHTLAQRIYGFGFDNLLVYRDGFGDWQKRGLPVSRGSQP